MNQIETAINLSGQVKTWWNELQKSSSIRTPEAEKRKNAFKRFREQGFPTVRHEDWKYTDVHKILDMPYAWPVKSEQQLTGRQFDALPFSHLEDAYSMVFVNGYYAPAFSQLPVGIQGVTISSIHEASSDASLQDYFDHEAFPASGFTSLNTALHTDGAFIHLEKGVTLDKPLFLYFIAETIQDTYFIQPRNLIIAEAEAGAKIIEVFVSEGDQPSLTNVVTELISETRSKVDYTKLQLERHQNFHVGSTRIRQGKESRVDTHIVSLDGAFIRNNLDFLMTDKHSESILNGLYLLGDEQFLDNHTQVDHAVPECVSDQLYKGIIDDKATAVFNGKVQVRKDAQKTNAYQRNVNILLSDDAVIDTKPQLEIYADDVRCTHGATTGFLNDEAIFYLRSRGIGEENARLMLMNAFAGEIVEKLNVDELKKPLMDMISAKLSRGHEAIAR